MSDVHPGPKVRSLALILAGLLGAAGESGAGPAGRRPREGRRPAKRRLGPKAKRGQARPRAGNDRPGVLHGPADRRRDVVGGGRLALPRDADRGGAARGDARRPQDPPRGDRRRRRRGGRLPQHPPGPPGRARGDRLATDVQPEMLRMLRQNARDGRRDEHQAPALHAGRHQAPRRQGRPDPDGRRLPRVLRPRGHPAGPAQGPQARRPAGPGRVPRRGSRGPDQARAQDDRRPGPPRGRAAGVHLQGLARIPPLAAHHHLREAGGEGREDRHRGRVRRPRRRRPIEAGAAP